jgi:hypothetical protein
MEWNAHTKTLSNPYSSSLTGIGGGTRHFLYKTLYVRGGGGGGGGGGGETIFVYSTCSNSFFFFFFFFFFGIARRFIRAMKRHIST